MMVMLSPWVTVAPAVSVTWTVKLDVPKAVGVPVIWAEVLELVDKKLKPTGRLPEITLQVNGTGAPPALTNASYGTPRMPDGSEVVVMASTAFTVIDSVAVIVEFATEVAVMVAVEVADKAVGAVYTTCVVVLPLNVPRPERLQVTPSLFLSLATVAVMVNVCPGFKVCPEAGASVMVRELLPEQPAKRTAQTRIPTANSDRALNFLKASPLKVLTTSVQNSKPPRIPRMRREPAGRSSG